MLVRCSPDYSGPTGVVRQGSDLTSGEGRGLDPYHATLTVGFDLAWIHRGMVAVLRYVTGESTF